MQFNFNSYQKMRLLFKAASTDFSRAVLNRVHWNAKIGRFEVTDGHILRVETWGGMGMPEGEAPGESLQFDAAAFPLTAAQFKLVHGKHGIADCAPMETDEVYPTIEAVMPTASTATAEFALKPEVVTRFMATIFPDRDRPALRFVMGPDVLKAIRVYTRDGYLMGVIMPARWVS